MKVALIGLATKNDHAFINLGALYIAAAIRDGGHQVIFIDLVRNGLNDREIEQRVRDFTPDLIAFSGIITTYYQLEHLSTLLRETLPDIPQLVGGSLGTSGTKIIESHTNIDLVCIGEGEKTVLLLLEQLRTDKNWEEVPNILYREGTQFRKSSCVSLPPHVEDLDSVPFPAYDLVDIEFYIDYTSLMMDRQKAEKRTLRAIPMVFSRGCPFSCSFCYRLTRQWRHHSIAYIISQLRELRDTYRINAIMLNDDLVFVNRRWFISLCEAIAASGLNFTFTCGGGKPSLVNEDVADAMRKAGFTRIGYGLESGSPKILKLMRKQVTVQQNYNAFDVTLRHGLTSRSNFVFGHPGEDRHTVKETLNFMNSLTLLQEQYGVLSDHFQCWFATPYPGTTMYDFAISRGLIVDEREYLLKVTSQDRYFVNLSDFKSVGQLKLFVLAGLTKLELRKNLRRRQWKSALRRCLRLASLYVVFCTTLGRYATLLDLTTALHLPALRLPWVRRREQLRQMLRNKHDQGHTARASRV